MTQYIAQELYQYAIMAYMGKEPKREWMYDI